jgi:hypothetical protein
MSILDDAIREHLELKRQHGADDAEIKRLEDEAFGPPGRPEEPDPFAEAPTEFMSAPDSPAVAEAEPEDRRRINIADLQEPPPATDAPLAPAEDAGQAAPPAEEPPAMEHDIVGDLPAEPAPAPGPDASAPEPAAQDPDQQAIAEQPTELFDVEAAIGGDDAPAPAEAPSPSDEEIAEVEAGEPKLAPVEPATEIHATRAEPAEAEEEYEEDEEFWSEQRLSDELDQALEAPVTEEHELEAVPDLKEAEDEGEYEEDDDDEEAPRPQAQVDYDPDTGHEDVLEDTPEFLEDAPEDDELWFEQRPPKDFDFDD